MERKSIMKQWDSWVKYYKAGGGATWPRDAFESLLDALDENRLTTKCCVLCPQSRKSGKCGIDEDLEKVDKPKKFTPPRYDEVYFRGQEWLNNL